MKKILTALVLCMMLVVTCAFADNYSADVVIIGSGGAGMSAAIVASDAGASVVILEQMNYNGGNTRRSEGGMNAAETVSQKALGIEDSVDVMFEDTMKGGKNISNPELVRYLAENSAESIDWLLSIGMDMTGVAQGAGATNPRMHRSADGAKIGGVLVPVLEKNLAERGIRILYATKATELVVTDGKVTGVTAVDANGNTLTFDAGAVVLATGGFGANPDIFVKYRPDLDGFSTTNHPGSNGSGIAMAQAIGADTVDMEQIQTNPTVDMNTNIVISETVRGKGAIFVNQSGERFVNEMLTRDVLSSAILELPEKYTYEVFDQNTMDSMKALQDDYDMGIVFKGETAEDLAEVLAIDPAVFTATIDSWNAAVAAGADEAFGRATGMDIDLSRAPYYAIRVSPAVHYTMGGVKINTLTQVINTEGNVIDGLFAAGEVTGGVHGGNRLGGNAVADIIIFGRQAGAQSSAYALVSGSNPAVLPAEVDVAAPAVEGNYADGVYEGTSRGRNGDISVKVTVENGSIVEIVVTDCSETAGIFDGVERDMIPQIIRTQSLDVDTVSGATMSSNGVLNAVAAALGL